MLYLKQKATKTLAKLDNKSAIDTELLAQQQPQKNWTQRGHASLHRSDTVCAQGTNIRPFINNARGSMRRRQSSIPGQMRRQSIPILHSGAMFRNGIISVKLILFCPFLHKLPLANVPNIGPIEWRGGQPPWGRRGKWQKWQIKFGWTKQIGRWPNAPSIEWEWHCNGATTNFEETRPKWEFVEKINWPRWPMLNKSRLWGNCEFLSG